MRSLKEREDRGFCVYPGCIWTQQNNSLETEAKFKYRPSANTAFIRTSKEKKKSNLVLTWDEMYLFLSCHLQNKWKVWAESSITTVKPAADT